jgi:hypothetical protein
VSSDLQARVCVRLLHSFTHHRLSSFPFPPPPGLFFRLFACSRSFAVPVGSTDHGAGLICASLAPFHFHTCQQYITSLDNLSSPSYVKPNDVFFLALSGFGRMGRSQDDTRFFLVMLLVSWLWRYVSLPRRPPSFPFPPRPGFVLIRSAVVIDLPFWLDSRPWLQTYHCFFRFPSTLVLANNTLFCSITCRPLPIEPNDGVFCHLTVSSTGFFINNFPSSIFLCTSSTNPGYI